MEPKELPEQIAAKLRSWMGGDASVSHFWKCGDTFLVVARQPSGVDGIYDFHCLRIFPIGDTLQLSQDNIIYG